MSERDARLVGTWRKVSGGECAARYPGELRLLANGLYSALPESEPRSSVAPGSYRKVAIAATAASSFITPILVLGVGGWWLDQRFHTGGILAFVGAVIGFAAGIIALLQVIRQLNQ